MKVEKAGCRLFLLTTTAAMSASLGISLQAIAQDEGDIFIFEEIVVTAQKRSQTLQETPIAVSVTDGFTIDQAHMLDISDIQSVVPSLRVWTLQSSSNTNFSIRGFGNGANNAGIESSVGVFIDGVYRSRSAARISDLPRLQRVEVLRGPQSTLFGKNASAGVVSVVTAPPSYDTEGGVEISYGNYDARTIKGYITGGISDTFAVSVSGGVNKSEGYIESLDPNVLWDINDRDRWHVRGQALWEPSESVSVRLITDYSKLDELCCGATNIQNGPTAAAIQLLGGAILDDSNPFAYQTVTDETPVNRIEDGGVSLQADIDLGSFTLTSISAFRGNDSFYDSEVDYTGAKILDSANSDTNIDTYTQEIRLASNGTNKLDWMIGGFFFKEDISQVTGLRFGNDTRAYIDLLTGAPGTLSTLEFLANIPTGSFFAADTFTRETFTQDNTAYSLFATVDYHFNDRLTVTGGLNYTKDKKTVTGKSENGDLMSSIDLFTVNGGAIPSAFFGQAFFENTGLAPTPDNISLIETLFPGTTSAITAGVNDAITDLQGLQFLPPFLSFPNSVEDGKTSDDKLTWTARVAYKVNDNINIYMSAATGYKATSWNLSRDSRPFLSDQAALLAQGLTQVNQSFGTRYAGPEEATVYEIGFKAHYRKGALNIALFDQTIKGFQANIFQGTGFVLSNAGKQSTKGIEIETTWVPTESLEIRASGTFLDPVFDSFKNAPGPDNTIVDLSGQKPAGVHEVSLSFAATYFFELGNTINGYVRGDWQYEEKVQAVTNVENVFRESSLFNASVGLNWDSGLSLSVWGRNLFNDEFYVSAFPGVIQAGTVYGFANQPRMYGVTLGYKF